MMKLTVTAASLALGVSAAANAGGYIPPVVETPVVLPVEEPLTWEGGYVGATLGYAFGGDDEVGLHYDPTKTYRGEIGNLDGDGLNGGLRAGYRWQRDNFVFGPELGFELTDISGETDGIFKGNEFTSEADFKIKNVLALRFKAGYLVQPDMQIYGIAGYARADIDYNLDGEDLGYAADGYILGLGLEKLLNENLSVTAEYEYANFGKENREIFDNFSTEATPQYSNVKLGLNYRF